MNPIRSIGFRNVPVREPVKDAEWVARWMREQLNDPWRDIEPVPFSSPVFLTLVAGDKRDVARMRAGVWRYAERPSLGLTARCVPVIEAIEDGRLIFTKENRGFREGRVATAYWLTKPDAPQRPQPSMVERAAYRYWAPCRSCGGRRYAVIDLQGLPHAACFACVPPLEYRSFGAMPLKDRVSLDMVDGAHHAAKDRVA